MIATWYVMEDGSVIDPSEVNPDDKGVLKHKDGRAVKMRGDVPHSRSVDVEQESAKASQKKEIQPSAPKRTYQTRTFKSASEPELPQEQPAALAADTDPKKED